MTLSSEGVRAGSVIDYETLDGERLRLIVLAITAETIYCCELGTGRAVDISVKASAIEQHTKH